MRDRDVDDDMAGGRAAAEEDTTEEAVYDVALEMLREGGLLSMCCGYAPIHPDSDRCSKCKDNTGWAYLCDGCNGEVDEDDAEHHARTCDKLRALAVEELSHE